MSEDSVLRQDQLKPELIVDEPVIVRVIDGFTGNPLIPEFGAQISLNDVYFNEPRPFVVDAMTLDRFYSIASQIIQDAQEREGVVASEQVSIVQDFQPERFAENENGGDEVISVRVIKRIPANMDRKGTGRPQRASSHHRDLRSAEYPNKVITVESRPIDHTIGFDVWAKTATLANRRAIWLEKLFITHTWAFQIQGVDRFYWEGRGQDTVWKGTGELRLHHRPQKFFVRIREFEVYGTPTIRQIDISTAFES